MSGAIPIIQLRGGEVITPRVPINDARARQWKYAKGCDSVHGYSLRIPDLASKEQVHC